MVEKCFVTGCRGNYDIKNKTQVLKTFTNLGFRIGEM